MDGSARRMAWAAAALAPTLLAPAAPASAQPVQSLVYAPAATDDCPVLIDAAERRRNIPHGLLMAIALTESGYGGRPSPVAMNIAGRAYHASGAPDMAWVVRQNALRGVSSIDVGCMQVNLKYHGSHFADPLQLLDSATNVEYAAGFLIRLAAESGSWREAVMSYHNRTNPGRRAWYGCKVWNNYLRVAGASIGYLSCGGAPRGSSTAAIGPAPAPRPVAVVAALQQRYAAPAADPGYRTVRVGSVDVAVTQRARRTSGSLEIAAAGTGMPAVLEDDSRASAFTSVRAPHEDASRSGFGQVSFRN